MGARRCCNGQLFCVLVRAPAAHHVETDRLTNRALRSSGRFHHPRADLRYTWWPAHAALETHRLSGRSAPLAHLFPHLTREYWRWANRSVVAGGPGRAECMWQACHDDGQENSIGLDGCRPTINAVMFGEVRGPAEPPTVAPSDSVPQRPPTAAPFSRCSVHPLLRSPAAPFTRCSVLLLLRSRASSVSRMVPRRARSRGSRRCSARRRRRGSTPRRPSAGGRPSRPSGQPTSASSSRAPTARRAAGSRMCARDAPSLGA